MPGTMLGMVVFDVVVSAWAPMEARLSIMHTVCAHTSHIITPTNEPL
jgi:hypothetical protein